MGRYDNPLHVGVDMCTPGGSGSWVHVARVHVCTGTRGRGAALVGEYAAEDRCLEKKEGCVSALQNAMRRSSVTTKLCCFQTLPPLVIPKRLLSVSIQCDPGL